MMLEKGSPLVYHSCRTDFNANHTEATIMGRPVTLFTGQWADLPFEAICKKAKSFGFDGLELACWGDHFDVRQGAKSKAYCDTRHEILARHGLKTWAISNHLAGQAVCDNIDERHKSILPPHPVSSAMIDDGFAFFAKMWNPILDEFKKCGVRFALEVHPTEIAFDTVTTLRAVAALKGRKEFGFNYDPSHLGYQHVDYVKFLRVLAPRIFHVHMKDVWWGHGDGMVGVFGGHTNFGNPSRYWDFRSLGHGDINFEEIIVALNDIGYQGPLSVEWEDSRMDREHGAKEACAFVKKLDFKSSTLAFDAAFDKSGR
jgi:sugar phosphate isomerase/epimerase